MEISQIDDKIEGWLYLIRRNRIGLVYLRKRYFVLKQNWLKSFKSIPNSGNQEPVRSAIIDSCIRITDSGRESYHGKIIFIFTIYNTSNHNDQIKLGARSPEEAARWIECLKNVALKPESYDGTSSKRKWQPFRFNVSKKTSTKSFVNWTSAANMRVDAMTSDVIAPSLWKIFGCQNGLRLFKEAKDKYSSGRRCDDNPAIMAVGVVDGSSEAIFRTLMSLGSKRPEWDFCFYRGSLVEHLDDHTDIIHMQFYKDFLPWGMRKRDFLLRRYWRREDDGTYVILYHSVIHRKCPPQPGCVRAFLKSGGYVVMPVDEGRKSVVKQMHAIDWKFWKPYLRKASARSLTIQMLMRLAALREMFKANVHTTCEILPQNGDKEKIVLEEENEESSLNGFSDPSDEFFDVPESSSDDGQSDQEWPSNQNSEYQLLDSRLSKTSSAATFVKRLHDFAVPKKVHVESQDPDHSPLYYYGSTFPKDSSCNQPCT